MPIRPHDKEVNGVLGLISMQNCLYLAWSNLGLNHQAGRGKCTSCILKLALVVLRVCSDHNDMNRQAFAQWACSKHLHGFMGGGAAVKCEHNLFGFFKLAGCN